MMTPKYFDWSQMIDVPLRIVLLWRWILKEQGARKHSSIFNSNSVWLKFPWYKDRQTTKTSAVLLRQRNLSQWIPALKFVKSENFANFCSFIFWFLKIKLRHISRINKADMIIYPYRVCWMRDFFKSLRIEQKHIITLTAWPLPVMLEEILFALHSAISYGPYDISLRFRDMLATVWMERAFSLRLKPTSFSVKHP